MHPYTSSILDDVAKELGAREIITNDQICKVSIVRVECVGMRSHAGIARKMLANLAELSINIQLITTTEIKITVVIDEKYMGFSVRGLHSVFALGGEIKSSLKRELLTF
ncbi:MAG: ACT domain-containing protein [Pseudomonadales bacterium]|nr:ACT domain-containing protein [Pseudomonadales bacterium]